MPWIRKSSEIREPEYPPYPTPDTKKKRCESPDTFPARYHEIVIPHAPPPRPRPRLRFCLVAIWFFTRSVDLLLGSSGERG